MEKTESLTSSIRRVNHSAIRGFTMVEVMVGATITSFVLAGVLATFLLMGRTSANMVSYTDIEAKARQALEIFSREVHNANNVTSYSGTSVTLTIPDSTSSDPNGTGTGAYTVTYTFDTANNRLRRSGPPVDNPTGTTTTTDLVTGIELVPGMASYLSYFRYVRPLAIGQGYVDGFGTANTAASALEIRQIEVSFVVRRTNVTVSAATNRVLSARFILRNKP